MTGGQDGTKMLQDEGPTEQVRMENSRQFSVKKRENQAQAPGRGSAGGVRLGWMGQKILQLLPSQSPVPSTAHEPTSPSLCPALLGSHPMRGQPSITPWPVKGALITQLAHLPCDTQKGRSREAPLDPRAARTGQHCWRCDGDEADIARASLLIHTQILQHHMSLGLGGEKKQQLDVHPAAHPVPRGLALSLSP